jgi:uncharacterized membrane protein
LKPASPGPSGGRQAAAGRADAGANHRGVPLVAVETTDFWLAVSTAGPVLFLAIGALLVELVRQHDLGWKRTWQKVELVTFNVAFFGTMLPTATAILSLAWGSNLLPPKILAPVIVLAILAFWASLVAHFSDLEATPRNNGH